jgi:hypothetical protein
MFGPMKDPVTMTPDEKLDFLMEGVIRLMGQVTTMNGCLDTHDRSLPDWIQSCLCRHSNQRCL